MPWISTAIVVLIIAVLLWRALRPVRLSPSARRKVAALWEHASSHADPHRCLLEADAVLSQLLEELGYRGSVADKLRKAKRIVPGLDDVWVAHKLRNRIAHEPGIRLTDGDVQRALLAFGRVVRKYT